MPRRKAEPITNVAPVIRGARETDTRDFLPPQRPSIILPNEGAPEHDTIIVADESVAKKDYLDELEFNENPLEIMVSASAGEHPEKFVFASVNGKGIEAFTNGRWVEMQYIPVGIWVKTKRKYAETLMRSRQDTITTQVENSDTDPFNRVNRFTTSKTPIQIRNDLSPRHNEWVERISRGV